MFLLKLCTMLPNTEPDNCHLWHAKSSYFQSTDTLRTQWPFSLIQWVGVAVENLNPTRIDHVALWWAADNRCDCARESVCPRSCSNAIRLYRLYQKVNEYDQEMPCNHTLQTNSSMNCLVTCKVYTDVGGIKIVIMYGRFFVWLS